MSTTVLESFNENSQASAKVPCTKKKSGYNLRCPDPLPRSPAPHITDQEGRYTAPSPQSPLFQREQKVPEATRRPPFFPYAGVMGLTGISGSVCGRGLSLWGTGDTACGSGEPLSDIGGIGGAGLLEL